MNKQITVDFLGTRGAFPLNIPETQKLGTETSCVVLSIGDDRLILDAGTGLNRLKPTTENEIILLSHFHYDHVLGLPYFLSRKQQGRVTLATACADNLDNFAQKLSSIFGGIAFPVELSDIFNAIDLVVGYETKVLILDTWKIRSIALNHPGGSTGYAVKHESSDKQICYLMDHEPCARYDNSSLIQFAKESDLVIYDAAYSVENYQNHQGYGHSTIEEGQHFRQQSGCNKIVFMGHSMERLDSEIPKITAALDTASEFLAYDKFRLNL